MVVWAYSGGFIGAWGCLGLELKLKLELVLTHLAQKKMYARAQRACKSMKEVGTRVRAPSATGRRQIGPAAEGRRPPSLLWGVDHQTIYVLRAGARPRW